MSEYIHPIVVVTACLLVLGCLTSIVMVVRKAGPTARVLGALAALLATLPPILYALATVAAG